MQVELATKFSWSDKFASLAFVFYSLFEVSGITTPQKKYEQN